MESYIYVLGELEIMEKTGDGQEERYIATTQMLSYVEAVTEDAVRSIFMNHICHYYLNILFRTYRQIHTAEELQNDLKKCSFISQNWDSVLLENQDFISPGPFAARKDSNSSVIGSQAASM